MTNNELVELINECLNNPDSKIDFHFLSDSDSCMISPRILEVKALDKKVALPRAEVWYKHYDLQDIASQEYLSYPIKIPFEIIDRFRNVKDPDILILFIHYRDKDRLDVYVK